MKPESFAVEVGGVDEPGDLSEAGGRSTELTYHGLSKDLRLASISHLSTTGSLLTRFGYDYNVLGQISKWEIQKQGAGAQVGITSFGVLAGAGVRSVGCWAVGGAQVRWAL